MKLARLINYTITLRSRRLIIIFGKYEREI